MAERRVRLISPGDPSDDPHETDEANSPPTPEEPVGGDPGPLAELLSLQQQDASDDRISSIANRHVQWVLGRHGVTASHNVVILHKSASLMRSDANRIYQGLSQADKKKPVLLLVSSPGGEIAPAYFIAKLCRQSTEESVKVAVARQAKSAATLICCGADEVHMGGLSELGPIDPQFGPIPALALKYSVEHLAQLASQYPGAKDMFSDYLSRSLNLQALGYYERVAESAKQYAERLLGSRRDPQSQEAREAISHRLVYTYKDHGFVIDAAEAGEIFGGEVVQTDTPEYQLANELYTALDLMEWFLEHEFERGFSFVGATDAAFVYSKPRQ